ncbi:MAG: hypothetical protein PWQ48_672 [Thermotogaceae bacterium]|nr:hypothetical protein [Thermotogaceae bacterium]
MPKKGFTLVELLISISITTVAIIIALMIFFAVLRSEKSITKLEEFHDFVTRLDLNLMNNYNEYFFIYPPKVEDDRIIVYYYDYYTEPSTVSSLTINIPSNYNITIIPTYTEFIDPPTTKVEVFINAVEISTNASLVYINQPAD